MLYAVHVPAQAPVRNTAFPAQAAQPGALPPPAQAETAGLSAAVSRPEAHEALVRGEPLPPHHPAAETSSPPAQPPLAASVQATTTLARAEARSPETVAASGPVGPDRSAQALPGNPLPPYPEAAREDGLEGSVSLAVALDAQGRVTAVQWLRRCGVAVLDHAAREAVRPWRFAPALRAGQPVASSLVLNLRFRLDAPQAQATVLASAALP
jgi:protein TonB